jgi:hypothetical protein
MFRAQKSCFLASHNRCSWLAAAAAVSAGIVLCLLPGAQADEDVADDSPKREVIATLESKHWLSNASCVSCHFQVPRQTAHDAWKAAMVKKGYIAESGLDDVHRQKKGQYCANCHQAASDLHGQCTRTEGCLRNAGDQKKVTYLGVSVGAVPQSVRQHVKLPRDVGLMIEGVDPDSPAANAELRTYDILERLDRQILVNQEQFSVLIKTYRPGQEVSLELIRTNEPKTLSVKLGERVVDGSSADQPALLDAYQIDLAARDLRLDENRLARVRHDQLAELVALEAKSDQRAPELVTYLGVNTSPPPDVLAQQLALPRGIYLVVDSVEADSPAAASGLRRFDVLQKLDDQLLVNSEQLTVLIRNRRLGDEVELTLIREGRPIKVHTTLGEHQVGEANVGQGAVVFDYGDYGSDGGLYVSYHNDGHFELVNDKLSKAVDLSVTGGDVKDEDFLRRIYLDLTGTPPAEKEVAEFTADAGPNKRQRLVERLLSRSDVIGKLSGNAVLQWSDNDHSLVLSTNESGEKRLLARDKNGAVVFDGSVNTDDQRQQLDARLVPKLELMLRGLSTAPQLEAPADAAAALERTLPRFQADEVTLNELLDRLRRETGANIVVDRKALVAAGVNLDEPLSLDLHDVRARTVLKTLLALAGGPKARLTHEIDDGVVLITTAH